MRVRASLHMIAAGAMAVSTAHAATVLTEDFEDSSLDPRISISTVGSFLSSPGIKTFAAIEGSKAFGFGRSTNRFNSFGNFVTSFTITFDEPTLVSSLSFREMEVFDNWGSNGYVLGDGLLIGSSSSFGRLPYNDRIADSSFRIVDLPVNQTVTTLVLRVEDITDLSEIYIDQISVSAVPEPSAAILFALGIAAVGVAARRGILGKARP